MDNFKATRQLFALFLLLGVLYHERAALAECNITPVHTTISHTSLPPNPRILLFASSAGEFSLEVTVDGIPTAVESEIIEDTNHRSSRAIWVRVKTGDGKVLRIVASSYEREQEFAFDIDPDWTPRVPELLGMERVFWNTGSTCPPPPDLLRISIASNAVAYRAQWAGSDPGTSIVPTHHLLRLGQQPYVLVAPTPGEAIQLPDLPHVVDLGQESCAGDSIPPALLDSGIAVELTALYPDGSEQKLGSIHLDSLPRSSGSYDKIWLLPTAKESTPPPREESDPSITTARLLAFCATFGMLGLLGLLIHRKPRLAILVGLAMAGTGIMLGATGLSASSFLPALWALLTWLLLRWLRLR